MGFESRAISARVTKQSVTIFSKTCDEYIYFKSHSVSNFRPLGLYQETNSLYFDYYISIPVHVTILACYHDVNMMITFQKWLHALV